MAKSCYIVEPLGRHHDRAAFSCGEASLDRYLKQQARQDLERSLAAVFVLLDTQEEHRIAGYYTLSALSVELTDLPEDVARRLPHYPIPTTLLGRLAVDDRYKGQRLGKALLFDALKRAYDQRAHIGSMAVVVDALDEDARAFYEYHEFRRFMDEPFRLFVTMKTIGELLNDM